MYGITRTVYNNTDSTRYTVELGAHVCVCVPVTWMDSVYFCILYTHTQIYSERQTIKSRCRYLLLKWCVCVCKLAHLVQKSEEEVVQQTHKQNQRTTQKNHWTMHKHMAHEHIHTMERARARMKEVWSGTNSHTPIKWNFTVLCTNTASYIDCCCRQDSLFIYSIITWHSPLWFHSNAKTKKTKFWTFSNNNSASSLADKSSDCQLELL